MIIKKRPEILVNRLLASSNKFPIFKAIRPNTGTTNVSVNVNKVVLNVSLFL